ncbi:MAG: cation diffusion facilitator family transporter [Burkholderiales bacterium]|nr:cation diffusion facilitator family transporter [Burkholderiales bacterium]
MQVKTLLKLSIAAAVATIVMKTMAWWITDSVGLLSDAMESFVNLASALFGLAMVIIAQRPADADHPFGHSKAEYFSSGFEGLLIAGAAAGILWAATHRLFNPQPLQALGWGLALAVASSVLNGLLAWRMMAASKQHRSIVLEADARHLYTDVWTTAGVVVGLIGVHLSGWLWLDPLLAIGVALNILREGAHLAWRSVEGLMDSALEPEVRAQIDRTLAEFAHSTIRFDHLVTRRAGQRRFLDVHMHMPSDWTLGRAAALRTNVEQALMNEVPGLRASIQLLPSNVEARFDQADDDRAAAAP